MMIETDGSSDDSADDPPGFMTMMNAAQQDEEGATMRGSKRHQQNQGRDKPDAVKTQISGNGAMKFHRQRLT